jgi:tRNA 2-selenouridine synthase
MGSRPIEYTDDVSSAGYSMVIDVRSPTEFAIDHMSGATNLPVLTDEERARVGTIYKQENSFTARKLGAAIVSRNIAYMLDGPLRDMDTDFHSLIYCWRGGQRSASLGIVLSQIGWRTTLLNGGYRTYRRKVVADLEVLPGRYRFVCLSGLTGTGKTRLLKHMKAQDCQVLDLEGLAEHRGSLLGYMPGAQQPLQKQFESRLWNALRSFDATRPVWVESESYKIGALSCPTEVWRVLRQATRVRIETPMAARVLLLLEDYAHFLDSPENLLETIHPLKELHGKEKVEHWTELVNGEAWTDFIQDMLEVHYDPAYRRSLKRHGGEEQHHLPLECHDHVALAGAAAWCESKFGK